MNLNFSTGFFFFFFGSEMKEQNITGWTVKRLQTVDFYIFNSAFTHEEEEDGV